VRLLPPPSTAARLLSTVSSTSLDQVAVKDHRRLTEEQTEREAERCNLPRVCICIAFRPPPCSPSTSPELVKVFVGERR
jgi:hypothetical protein